MNAMHTAMPATSSPAHAACAAASASEVVETRLWLEEHEWLYALLRSENNIAPTFRFPDLLSACIALVFSKSDAAQRIFGFLSTALVMRSPATPRRRESLWQPQYELLHELQCSPANRHPNPKFGLDQLTTACVALCRQDDSSGAAVLHQARCNMVERHTISHRASQYAR